MKLIMYPSEYIYIYIYYISHGPNVIFLTSADADF